MSDPAVTVRRSACLRTRLLTSGCRACADACPVHALHVGPPGVTLHAGCTGCGRCRAACPMGAIEVAGFAVSVAAPQDSEDTVLVDCARFGAAPGGDGIRVPCLGGLSEGDLLTFCAQWPQRTLLLADRGTCADCDSGGPVHPAAAVVRRVTALMREVNVPQERLPRLVRLAAGPVATDPMQVAGRARRGFLRALARPATAVAISAPPATGGRASRPRQALVQALRALAHRHHGRLPDRLFHRLALGPSCQGHRGCAAACPTGALLRYRDDRAGRVGIAFDTQLCIGCGQCAAACPQQAIRLAPGAGADVAGPRVLSAFRERECADCGARFAAPAQAAETRCVRCRRGAALARSAFATLFPASTLLHPE